MGEDAELQAEVEAQCRQFAERFPSCVHARALLLDLLECRLNAPDARRTAFEVRLSASHSAASV
jgi:hypothetical protein